MWGSLESPQRRSEEDSHPNFINNAKWLGLKSQPPEIENNTGGLSRLRLKTPSHEGQVAHRSF